MFILLVVFKRCWKQLNVTFPSTIPTKHSCDFFLELLMLAVGVASTETQGTIFSVLGAIF